MKYYSSISLGYVEQAISGGKDPLSPPISISRNGTLAKWRDKLDFLDLRVNDPGLKVNKAGYEDTLKKAQSLEVFSVITLPEFTPTFYDLPLENEKNDNTDGFSEKKTERRNSRKLVYYLPSYLALSEASSGTGNHRELHVEDCMPVIELALEYEVENIVVPVSEPGVFLDPLAEGRFQEKLGVIGEYALSKGLKIHLRNGGLAKPSFLSMVSKMPLKLAYNVGIGHLERDNILETYREMSSYIDIVTLQQVLPGVDKWSGRRERIFKALNDYLQTLEQSRHGSPDLTESSIKSLAAAFKRYRDSCRNESFNIGLFQNGDLNLLPLLKEMRKNLSQQKETMVTLEVVPNLKNNDFVLNNIVPDRFRGSI